MLPYMASMLALQPECMPLPGLSLGQAAPSGTQPDAPQQHLQLNMQQIAEIQQRALQAGQSSAHLLQLSAIPFLFLLFVSAHAP
jgi:hypothetical protein